MHFTSIALLLGTLPLSPPAAQATVGGPARPAWALAVSRPDPPSPPQTRSLPALVQAAWRRADLDVPKRRAWTRRVRVATLLPEVSVGYDRRRDRGWDHHLQLDAPDELDTDAKTAQTFRFRATWDLSRLVYSNDELRVAQTILDIQSRRAAIRAEVQSLFERRREKIATWTMAAPRDPLRVTLESEIRQLTEALELLCGVEF